MAQKGIYEYQNFCSIKDRHFFGRLASNDRLAQLCYLKKNNQNILKKIQSKDRVFIVNIVLNAVDDTPYTRLKKNKEDPKH